MPANFFRIICLVLMFTSRISFADWHGDIRLLSDYFYRGYTKSLGNPVVQAHIDYSHANGWFTGLGISQVRFDDEDYTNRAAVELMPYMGWHIPIVDELRAEFSVYGYIYDDKIYGQVANYAELYVSLHYQDWLSVRASFAPNAYQQHADVADYELNYRWDLLDTVQFSAGLGYNQAESLFQQDYFYWNAGITWFVTLFLALDLRYVDSALNAQNHIQYYHNEFYPPVQENKYLFSLTVGF